MYVAVMISSVLITRAKERHADVIDVLEELGNGDFGSAANAAAALIRQHPLFHPTLDQIRKRRRSETPASALD